MVWQNGNCLRYERFVFYAIVSIYTHTHTSWFLNFNKQWFSMVWYHYGVICGTNPIHSHNTVTAHYWPLSRRRPRGGRGQEYLLAKREKSVSVRDERNRIATRWYHYGDRKWLRPAYIYIYLSTHICTHTDTHTHTDMLITVVFLLLFHEDMCEL